MSYTYSTISPGWSVRVHQLKCPKKKSVPFLSQESAEFFGHVFSPTVSAHVTKIAKLQQGSHATAWPVEQAGQTLRLRLQEFFANDYFRKRFRESNTFALGLAKCLKVCVFLVIVQWNTWGLPMFWKTSGISSCQLLPKMSIEFLERQGVTLKIWPKKGI